MPAAAQKRVPVLGINMGRMGFCWSLILSFVRQAADAGRLCFGKAMMLKCELDDGFSSW